MKRSDFTVLSVSIIINGYRVISVLNSFIQPSSVNQLCLYKYVFVCIFIFNTPSFKYDEYEGNESDEYFVIFICRLVTL